MSEQEQNKTTKSNTKPAEEIPTKPNINIRDTEDEDTADRIEENYAISEIDRGYRILRNTKWGDIRIYKDTKMWVTRDGDEAYMRERNKLLDDPGVKTVAELTPLLKERGIWSEEKEDEIVAVSEEIDKINEKIDKAKKETEKNGLRAKLEKRFNDFMDLIVQREEIFGLTLEFKSEMARRTAMMLAAVRKHVPDIESIKDIERVWGNEEDMYNEDAEDFYWVQRECQKYWQNRDATESFFEESPAEKTSN